MIREAILVLATLMIPPIILGMLISHCGFNIITIGEKYLMKIIDGWEKRSIDKINKKYFGPDKKDK